MQPLTNISGQTQNKYSSVVNQPALLVLSGAGASGWDIVLDVVEVNGVNVPLQSSIPGAPSGRRSLPLTSGARLCMHRRQLLTLFTTLSLELTTKRGINFGSYHV